MRPICLIELDRVRPALLLTREAVRAERSLVTVAPISSTVRGLSTEVALGPANGFDHACVASMDNITTVPVSRVRQTIGYLLDHQEAALAQAAVFAFDLGIPLEIENLR